MFLIVKKSMKNLLKLERVVMKQLYLLNQIQNIQQNKEQNYPNVMKRLLKINNEQKKNIKKASFR